MYYLTDTTCGTNRTSKSLSSSLMFFYDALAGHTQERRRAPIMSVESLTTISPTTNEAILIRNGVSQSDLELLPQTATEAFKSWRTTSLAERQTIVRAAMALLSEKADDLALELTVQMGRPIAYTAKEITTAVKRADYLVKISDDALGDTDGEPEKGFKRLIRKVPVGPVLIIFPWNVRRCPNPGEPVVANRPRLRTGPSSMLLYRPFLPETP